MTCWCSSSGLGMVQWLAVLHARSTDQVRVLCTQNVRKVCGHHMACMHARVAGNLASLALLLPCTWHAHHLVACFGYPCVPLLQGAGTAGTRRYIHPNNPQHAHVTRACTLSICIKLPWYKLVPCLLAHARTWRASVHDHSPVSCICMPCWAVTRPLK